MSETSIFADVYRWLPFVLWGFGLNVLMSVLAIVLGTTAGVFLGLGQISRIRLVGGISRLATQLFRNAPWLVEALPERPFFQPRPIPPPRPPASPRTRRPSVPGA